MTYLVTDNCILITDTTAAIIREKALKECYLIPGYKQLPIEYKNIIYDRVIDRIQKDGIKA